MRRSSAQRDVGSPRAVVRGGGAWLIPPLVIALGLCVAVALAAPSARQRSQRHGVAPHIPAHGRQARDGARQLRDFAIYRGGAPARAERLRSRVAYRHLARPAALPP